MTSAVWAVIFSNSISRPALTYSKISKKKRNTWSGYNSQPTTVKWRTLRQEKCWNSSGFSLRNSGSEVGRREWPIGGTSATRNMWWAQSAAMGQSDRPHLAQRRGLATVCWRTRKRICDSDKDILERDSESWLFAYIYSIYCKDQLEIWCLL